MPLTQAGLTNKITWSLARTNAGYRNTSQGPESQSFTLNGLNVNTFDQIATNTYSIASGGFTDVDLTGLTNLVYEEFGLGHVLTLVLQPTVNQVTLSPAPASGLQWFFGGVSDSLTVPASGCFLFTLGASSPGQAVDDTHKFMRLTASGAGATTVDVVILGSTG